MQVTTQRMIVTLVVACEPLTRSDVAGNTSACSSAFNYTEDSTPPQTTIDSGPFGITEDPTPTFGFSSDEPGSRSECRVDGAPFGRCSGPGNSHTTGLLADGDHRFGVRATDRAENVEADLATRFFIVESGGGDGGDDEPPRLDLGGKLKQRLGKQKGMIVTARCQDEDCGVVATGVLKRASTLRLSPPAPSSTRGRRRS